MWELYLHEWGPFTPEGNADARSLPFQGPSPSGSLLKYDALECMGSGEGPVREGGEGTKGGNMGECDQLYEND